MKKIILFIIEGILIVSLMACGKNTESSENYAEKAQQAMNKKNYSEAVDSYKQALKKDSKNIDFYKQLYIAAVRNNDRETAINALNDGMKNINTEEFESFFDNEMNKQYEYGTLNDYVEPSKGVKIVDTIYFMTDQFSSGFQPTLYSIKDDKLIEIDELYTSYSANVVNSETSLFYKGYINNEVWNNDDWGIIRYELETNEKNFIYLSPSYEEYEYGLKGIYIIDGRLYFGDGSKILSTNLDGSDLRTIFDGTSLSEVGLANAPFKYYEGKFYINARVYPDSLFFSVNIDGSDCRKIFNHSNLSLDIGGIGIFNFVIFNDYIYMDYDGRLEDGWMEAVYATDLNGNDTHELFNISYSNQGWASNTLVEMHQMPFMRIYDEIQEDGTLNPKVSQYYIMGVDGRRLLQGTIYNSNEYMIDSWFDAVLYENNSQVLYPCYKNNGEGIYTTSGVCLFDKLDDEISFYTKE